VARSTRVGTKRRSAPRKDAKLAELAARVDALVERVTLLEKGRVGPGDGRAAVPKRDPKVKRCPGCGLPLRRRSGRCAECGRPVDVP
jgi:hypothetical protein